MLLAGLLLKLGGCGLYRFHLLLPECFTLLSYYLLGFLLISMVLARVVTSVQRDIKRLVAYSSVVHITAVGLLFLLDRRVAMSSALILMTLHGISSPLIFYMVGQIYRSTGTRLLISIRGGKQFLPLLYLSIIVAFYLTVPVPPSLSFLGEVYLFRALFKYGSLVVLISGVYLFLSIIFNLL